MKQMFFSEELKPWFQKDKNRILSYLNIYTQLQM